MQVGAVPIFELTATAWRKHGNAWGCGLESRRSDAAAYELTHDYDVAESGRYLESGHEPFQ